MTTLAHGTDQLNGINVPVLRKLIDDVKADKTNASTHWAVSTRWVDGAITETQVSACDIGGKHVKKNFTIRTDEPEELAGTNLHANPQETLMAAFNACMTVGYVALSSLMGITLDSVEIDCDGDLDLRGFLGLDRNVKPGYDEIRYTVRIKGNGTPDQFRRIHETVMANSPNRFNLSQPIRLVADLKIL